LAEHNTSPGHAFRCFYPVGTPENKAAFEANLAAGLPQTLAAAGKVLATEEVA
jgi:hypothetical protein